MSPRKSDQLLPADPTPRAGGDAPPITGTATAPGASGPATTTTTNTTNTTTTPARGAAAHHEPAGARTPALGFLKANVVLVLTTLAMIPLGKVIEEQVDAYYVRVVTLIGYNVILAVSLQLINGVSGQFSLGHAGFMAVGAYLAAYPAKTFARNYADPASVALFYVALGVAAAIVGGVLYGLLRGAGTLKRVHRAAPGAALLLLVAWFAVDVARLQGTPWGVWSRAIDLVQRLFQATIDHGGPVAAKLSGLLPDAVARPACFVVLLAGAGLCAAAAGLVVGLPALRLRGDYLAIVTLGMAEIIRIAIQNSTPLGGALGLTTIPRNTDLPWLYACVVLTVACVWRVAYSARGRAIMAVREDEIAAASIGIDTTRQKVTAFVLGASLAGVAGALYAMRESAITPTRFTLDRSIEVVVMVTLGGLGSVTGAIVAAVLLTILPEALRGSFLPEWAHDIAEYRMIIYSALLIVMMLARPRGLMGTRELSLRPLLRLLPARAPRKEAAA
jgi:ABC-type branched-subunit amino acid transport system permease subunit